MLECRISGCGSVRGGLCSPPLCVLSRRVVMVLKILLLCAGLGVLTYAAPAAEEAPDELTAKLEAIRIEYHLPALASAAMHQRYSLLRGLVTRPIAAPRGSKFIYSNEGYAIAGAMIERVTGRAWEDLMRERIFEPLGMKSAGFGTPASPGEVDQPWGHAGN